MKRKIAAAFATMTLLMGGLASMPTADAAPTELASGGCYVKYTFEPTSDAFEAPYQATYAVSLPEGSYLVSQRQNPRDLERAVRANDHTDLIAEFANLTDTTDHSQFIATAEADRLAAMTDWDSTQWRELLNRHDAIRAKFPDGLIEGAAEYDAALSKARSALARAEINAGMGRADRWDEFIAAFEEVAAFLATPTPAISTPPTADEVLADYSNSGHVTIRRSNTGPSGFYAYRTDGNCGGESALPTLTFQDSHGYLPTEIEVTGEHTTYTVEADPNYVPPGRGGSGAAVPEPCDRNDRDSWCYVPTNAEMCTIGGRYEDPCGCGQSHPDYDPFECGMTMPTIREEPTPKKPAENPVGCSVGEVTLTKTAEDTGETLAGAEFEVTMPEGIYGMQGAKDEAGFVDAFKAIPGWTETPEYAAWAAAMSQSNPTKPTFPIDYGKGAADDLRNMSENPDAFNRRVISELAQDSAMRVELMNAALEANPRLADLDPATYQHATAIRDAMTDTADIYARAAEAIDSEDVDTYKSIYFQMHRTPWRFGFDQFPSELYQDVISGEDTLTRNAAAAENLGATQTFTVKTDENGKATLALYGVKPVYTDSGRGDDTCDQLDGTLVESLAPEGYTATEDSYRVSPLIGDFTITNALKWTPPTGTPPTPNAPVLISAGI